MNHQEMWAAFCNEKQIRNETYEAWAFGDSPDELAELVLRGVKTATASAAALYALENEPLPKEGEYSVILNAKGEGKCVIQTTKVYIAAFGDVSSRHAWMEGEGDRSLTYWRKVHEAFFRRCLQEAGLTFEPRMEVVCEEFRVVYRETEALTPQRI